MNLPTRTSCINWRTARILPSSEPQNRSSWLSVSVAAFLAWDRSVNTVDGQYAIWQTWTKRNKPLTAHPLPHVRGRVARYGPCFRHPLASWHCNTQREKQKMNFPFSTNSPIYVRACLHSYTQLWNPMFPLPK